MRKALICLSIVAILMCCVPNAAAAPTAKYSTDFHSDRIMDVEKKLETYPYAALSDSERSTAVEASNFTVMVSKTAFLDGRLGVGETLCPPVPPGSQPLVNSSPHEKIKP